jgi:DNA-binding NtrC family response regulator
MIKILLADDDKNLRIVLTSELSSGGYEVLETESGSAALELMNREEYDVLLLDLNMPGMHGMDVLRKMRSLEISTEVVILTANATVSTAVEAMKLGAYDFLTKPFKLDELTLIIEKAYEKKKLLSENFLLKSRIRRQSEEAGIITRSPLMLEILETVKKVALSELPVLIVGESGAGKELIAKAVHGASGRAEQAFIPVNCGAIAENMLESELFGHEKGAFTGAHARKPGLLEIADQGTLFLDEIGELPLPLQVKLLRVLETGRFFRVGGIKEIRVHVKFLSASNKDLKAEVERGAFRADLYYRISALALHIPPLRERKDDIPVLIEHFRVANPAFRRKRFTKDAVSILSQYPWPGNVRELQNVVHRILLLSTGDVIESCTLPSDFIDCRRARDGRRLVDVEREHILAVLQEAGGHRGKAAEILGIDPKTLYRKLLEFGVKE